MSKNHLVLIVVAILLASLLISFLPNNGAVLIIIKFLIVFVVCGGVYLLLQQYQPAQNDEISTDENRENLSENTSVVSANTSQVNTNQNVEEYFEQFLNIVFPLIKQTTVSETVVLLMVNYFKQNFYIRHMLSGNSASSGNGNFIDLNYGLPSLVVKHNKAILENKLPDNEGLLPYHNASDVHPKSFMAVPLYFDDYIVGVLCADSDVEQAFSEDDLQILTSFSQSVAIQLACSNKLYEFESENWTTKLLYDFSKGILEIQSTGDLWEYLNRSIKKVFAADRVIVAEKINSENGAVVHVSGQHVLLRPGEKFPNNEGLLGWVMRKNESIIIEDFSEKENYIPRMSLEETPAGELKSLLAVPVAIDQEAQMVISVESFKANHYNEQHKKILETMAYQVAAFLEKAKILNQLETYNLIDPETELRNAKALKTDLTKEVCRANRFNKNFCFQLLKISAAKSEIEPSLYEKLISEFLHFAQPLFNEPTTIYKFNSEYFAILWPEQVLREVFSTFQEIYQKISQRGPWVGGLIEKIYVNCGVVEYPQMGLTDNELLENAQKALRKAEKRGPNTMEIYEVYENPSASDLL